MNGLFLRSAEVALGHLPCPEIAALFHPRKLPRYRDAVANAALRLIAQDLGMPLET